MARITVEDCLENVDNRFELVMVSSKRARQIQTGGKDALVSLDNDKPTVLALREIADGLVDAKILIEKPSVELQDVAQELEGVESDAAETTEAAPEESTEQVAPPAEDA